MLQGPFFQMTARIHRKVDGFPLNLRRSPLVGWVWYGEVESSRSQLKAAKLQHLAPAFEDRPGRFNEGDPNRNQPTTPKVRSASAIGYTPTGARKAGHEDCPVGAAEIESHIELLAPQRAKDLPLLSKRAFVRRHLNRPRAIHTRSEFQHFATERRGQHMQLRLDRKSVV